MLRQWERTGYMDLKCQRNSTYIPLVRQTKITLQCGSEEELLVMQAQAQSLNLCARSIQDA